VDFIPFETLSGRDAALKRFAFGNVSRGIAFGNILYVITFDLLKIVALVSALCI